MTRELLQQALETLEILLCTPTARKQAWDTIDALRAALAQQEPEPVALESVHLTRDTSGMCKVHVNGRLAIHDNGDIIDHMATLEWFAHPPAQPAPTPCCGEYATCRIPCVPREDARVAAAQPAPVPADDVGQLEYKGNSVAFIHQKMTAYRKGIDDAWAALRSAGIQPDGHTSIAQAIAKLAAPPAQPAPVPAGWMPIESAPQDTREMFVVRGFRVDRGGSFPYTTDPWCVWRSSHGGFARWPHPFPPTHWMPLPPAPGAAPPAQAVPLTPLTDAQISNLWDGHIVPVFGKTGINPIVFARAIERAHGITAPEANNG